MRKILDQIYLGAGITAAGCLIAILFIIVAQMVCRWVGVSFPGSTAYAGYFMASASFLAFAYTLNHDAHIRVSLVLNLMGKYRTHAEIWCFSIATLAAIFLAYYAVDHTIGSWIWNDISQERDEMPLWIPQIPVAIGAILMAVAFVDNLVCLITQKRHNMSGEKVGSVESVESVEHI